MEVLVGHPIFPDIRRSVISRLELCLVLLFVEFIFVYMINIDVSINVHNVF